jgi:CyaY protein
MSLKSNNMTESEFNQYVDETLIQIEDALDELDIDFETAGGILTIIMQDQSQLIINRQGVTRQLWLAARSGGFHFNLDEAKGWIDDRSGESFNDTLNRCLSDQAGSNIDLVLS